MSADDDMATARKQRELDQLIEHFERAYRPRDSREGCVFDAALHRIVRAVYAEAQEPLLRQMGALVRSSLDLTMLMEHPPAIKPEHQEAKSGDQA